jgi:hypothetical protein
VRGKGRGSRDGVRFKSEGGNDYCRNKSERGISMTEEEGGK